MVAKSLFTLLLALGILAGCSSVSAEKEPPFLSPASGGNVMMASVPATRSPHHLSAWRFNNIRRFTKWTSVLARLDRETALPPQWQAQLPQLEALPVSGRAQAVNSFVNSFAYLEDSSNWGLDDYWGSPGEFYARGGGDCEDFAIAKYAMLRELGVPEDSLRITVVYDRYTRGMHALLVVYNDDDTLLLDNQIAALHSPEAARRYVPVFGLSRKAWWLYSNAAAA